MHIEEIEVKTKDLPGWWNNDVHIFKEKISHLGLALSKHCLLCERDIPESGCIHNKINIITDV